MTCLIYLQDAPSLRSSVSSVLPPEDIQAWVLSSFTAPLIFIYDLAAPNVQLWVRPSFTEVYGSPRPGDSPQEDPLFCPREQTKTLEAGYQWHSVFSREQRTIFTELNHWMCFWRTVGGWRRRAVVLGPLLIRDSWTGHPGWARH